MTREERRVSKIIKKIGYSDKIWFCGTGKYFVRGEDHTRVPDFKVHGERAVIEVACTVPLFNRVFKEYREDRKEFYKQNGYRCLVINGKDWSYSKIKRKLIKFMEHDKPLKVLGLDPGVKNFACVMNEGNKAVWHDWLKPIEEISSEGLGRFKDRFDKLLDLKKPNVVVIERFIVRGPAGRFGEPINAMITAVCISCLHKDIKCIFVTPSAWKTWAGKIGLKKAKKFKKAKFVHFSDAYGMTKYALAKKIEVE